MRQTTSKIRSVLLLCAAASAVAPAQTFTTIYNFGGIDGSYPAGPLAQGADGLFYGTTMSGGTGPGGGPGTVFKITTSGALTTLHSFDYTDGAEPSAGVTLGRDGRFYGTTSIGGPTDYGTVFRITPGGTLTTLHTFCPAFVCSDGAQPNTPLIEAGEGEFYGTTLVGGSATCRLTAAPGCGTIFKISPAGALTTLYSFNYTDGAEPTGLVQAASGNFYGTTYAGTATCLTNGCGTVFEMTPGGTLTTLHTFDISDGAFPDAPLVQAATGDFFGTTFMYGAYNLGTIFKMTPSGALTTMFSFAGIHGGEPQGLVQATDGNLYGISAGGTSGTVFKMTPAGALTTIRSFNGADGLIPTGLIQGTDGNLYGTTQQGGLYRDGTIFALSVGLKPFVKTLPTAGPPGSTVLILGTNLTGASAVTFNGTASAFTVVSPTLVTTTVPGGATSGKVRVIAPGGTLVGNVAFQVRP